MKKKVLDEAIAKVAKITEKTGWPLFGNVEFVLTKKECKELVDFLFSAQRITGEPNALHKLSFSLESVMIALLIGYQIGLDRHKESS